MFQIKMQNRMSDEWTTLWTREPLQTVEQANERFEKFEYDSDFSNYQIVDENGNVVRDWLKEREVK